MNPSPESRPETHVADFAEILSPSDGSEPPVIVGGHAVNLWAMYFLSGGVDELADYQPFPSKDLDVNGGGPASGVGSMRCIEALLGI